MKRKKSALLLLLLSLVLAAAIGMVACSERQNGSNGGTDPSQEEDDNGGSSGEEKVYNVNYYLDKISEGMKATINMKTNENDPLVEYAVISEYTFKTDVENYTLHFEVVYGSNAEKNKYYLYLVDHDNHINRATIYYDSTDLYLDSDKGRYKVSDFNALLLYEVFSHLMNKLDLYRFFYGELMTTYFRTGSLLNNAFSPSDCSANFVGNNGEAVYFKNGDFSILISTLNARIEAITEGIGTSFDSVTYNMLGFRLSKLIEYSFNAINVEFFRFLLEDNRVYDTKVSINGRMLNGSEYFLHAEYKYDLVERTISEGEKLKKKYEFDAITPGTGSFEGDITFPTIREEAFAMSLDYDLNSKDNKLNRFTFRIYDQLSTESEVTDKYANISEFLSLYYVNEIMYLNAEGFCHFIGTPVELESLHLPKVYFANMDLCSAMHAAYNYLIRIIDILTDYNTRTENKSNRELYEALMDAISSPDLQSFRVTVTEDLIKDIRGDDTSLAMLLSRKLTGRDEALSNVIPNDFFQLLTVVFTYKFLEEQDNIIVQGFYDNVEQFNGTFYRIPYAGITLPKDLNDIYYTLFEQPEVVTLDYDVSLTPYNVSSVDAGKFFGLFVGDASGQNTPCVINTGESISVRGKVSETNSTNSSGERVAVSTVYLSFYKKTSTTEETLMTVISNPMNLDELLVCYYGEVGPNNMKLSGGLRFRIPVEAVKSGMEQLTDENNLFLSGSNFAILLGLLSSLTGNSETYVRDNRYVISIMANENKDPVEEMIGISDTFTIFRIQVSFARVDLSSVTVRDYGTPYIEGIENKSVPSIYTNDSKWQETLPVYINGIAVEMYLPYTEESITVETGIREYYPTAYLFGQKIQYRVAILNIDGTYLITDLLTGSNTITFSYAFSMMPTNATDVNVPRYLLVIDPAYTKKLPTTADVQYDNFEVGNINCTVEGFQESNITRDGYNLPLLAGDYQAGIEKYTLRIGNNSIKSYTFTIYIAVINRNVVSVKRNETEPAEERMAYINNEQKPEKTMGREIKSGTEQITVIDKKNVPVVGEIDVNPYTYGMMKASLDEYNLITSAINDEQMRIYFYGFYGTGIEKNEETSVEMEYNKYYNKEGYNYLNLSERVSEWKFDESLISWQGGVYYATAVFGSEEGYSILIAIRVIVHKNAVKEVCIDDETQSIYTIDYLIKSTYTIPITSTGGHTVKVIFQDDAGNTKTRTLIPNRLGTLSDQTFYEDYLLGSLNWAGTENLASRITEEGTSSLFGSGQNATSMTKATLGGSLSVGTQEVTLNVLQPSRRQSGEDEKSFYLVKQYNVTTDEADPSRVITTPVSGHVSISKAKFMANDEEYAYYGMNPYDFNASLPTSIYLYVNRNSIEKVWKQYTVNWQTTDKEGRELNLIKERNGRFSLAYPSTQQRDLVVYGCIGDGNGVIWVKMIVRNLFSELQEIKFYSYNYREADVRIGTSMTEGTAYYEFYTDGYALTEDNAALANKIYYTRQEYYVIASEPNSLGTYYEFYANTYRLTTYSPGSGKTYYEKRYQYIQAPLLAGTSLEDGAEMYYEHKENAYGLTSDGVFQSGKTYYVYEQTEILPERDYLFIDPYDSYDGIIPTKFEAILGSGAKVTSEDVDEEGNVLGLNWYAVINGEEYPLIRSGKFLLNNKQNNMYYDENNKFIFPWNVGNSEPIGLKCYIKGSGDITNEAVLNLNVRLRSLYTIKDDQNKDVNYIDIYNGDDAYAAMTAEDMTTKGIYTGRALSGFSQMDCYDQSSSALLERLTLIRNMQLAGQKVYVGVRFSTTEKLYSLPVRWDNDMLSEMIISLTTAKNQATVGYLTGVICPDTVNEQPLQLPFSVKEVTLTALKPNNANVLVQQDVYSITNDLNKNARLDIDELKKVREYSVGDQYLSYISSSSTGDIYSAGEYSYIIYLDIEKAYALTDNRDGYFCTPYEYLTYLFNSLTLYFQGGMEISTTAGNQLKLIGTNHVGVDSADYTQKLIDYFNSSVLGLLDGTDGKANTIFTEDGYRYSYSFIMLNKFSQGSILSKSLIVVRSILSSCGTTWEERTIEPFNRDLTMAYGGDRIVKKGYPLPTYEDTIYYTDDNVMYNVRYKVDNWTPKSTADMVLDETNKKISQERIDVVNGAKYTFYYNLPCSGIRFELTVEVPQKDLRVGFNSAEGETYKIVNGVIQINNPFTFIYYDQSANSGAGAYVIDRSRIPNVIYPNLTVSEQGSGDHVYKSTQINSYEINWVFKDKDENGKPLLTAARFLEGGTFCLATFEYQSYWVYNKEQENYLLETIKLSLEVSLAQLTFYGIKDLEDVYVTETDGNDLSGQGKEESNLLNNIEVDPYAGLGEAYNLPKRMTLLFNYNGGEDRKGQTEFTFGNLSYYFSKLRYRKELGAIYGETVAQERSETLGRESLVSVGYNQSGYILEGDKYKSVKDVSENVIYLTMNVYLGDGTVLGGGLSIQLTILVRKIDKTRIYNTVYREGLIKDYGTDSYLFVEATVQDGAEITSNTFYETDESGSRFYLTMDTAFNADKKYYTRIYQDKYDTESATSYVYVKANVKEGGKVSSGTYYIYNGSDYVLTGDLNFRTGVEYYTRTNSLLYKTASYYEKATVIEQGKDYYSIERANTTAGDTISKTYYCPDDMDRNNYYPEATYSFESASGKAQVGQAYYTPNVVDVKTAEPADIKVGDPIRFGTYYIASEAGKYVAARGVFEAGTTYYTFTQVELKAGRDIPRNHYKMVDAAFGRKNYYVVSNPIHFTAAQVKDIKDGIDTNPYYIMKIESGNTWYQKVNQNDIDQLGEYYTFTQATVKVGYRLSEKYYEYIAGRYEETADEVFSKTKQYYIFRKIPDPSASDDCYSYFVGFEGESFHAEASVTRESNKSGSSSTKEMSVYYIDPYNTSTFRLPKEVYLKFTTTSDFRAYPIRGWQLYDPQTGRVSDFKKYTVDPSAAGDAWTLYTSGTPERFYQVQSSVAGTSYGYFMPQEGDYSGAAYWARAYIKVGNQEQYFDVLIVVLNRSLRISAELGHSYSLSYDYEDPVGGLLADISAVMREEMFVSYDSYYHNVEENYVDESETVSVEYRISESSAYGYRNGNVPVIPTIIWKEEWNYDGNDYSFNGVSVTGYDGPIFGNVFMDDCNIENLYTHYYDTIMEKYSILINAWMWDVLTTQEYSEQTAAKIRSQQAEMDKDIIVKGYDMLCATYKVNAGNSDITQQEYYSFITQEFYNEILRDLQRRYPGEGYNAVSSKREIVLTMYEQLKAAHDEWKAAGSNNSKKAGRPQIFEDWEKNIGNFKAQLYLPTTENDAIKSDFNEYIVLKASYYAKFAETANNFTNSEEKFNQSYIQRYVRKLNNCILRDVWDNIYEYCGITQRNVMQNCLRNYNGTDTYTKAMAIEDFLRLAESLGVQGEDTQGYITIPVLEYNRLLEADDGTKVDTIYFSPFDFKTIKKEYAVEFLLDYSEIYRKKIEQATKDVTSDYRDEYAGASLEELRNILAEKGINSIAPIIDNGDGTYTNKLTFTLNGEKEFTYQNYLDALKTLYSTYSTDDTTLMTWEELYEKILNKENADLYSINDSLWDKLYAYYRSESLKIIDNNISPGLLNEQGWSVLSSAIDLASRFAAAEGRDDFHDYYENIKIKMSQLKEDRGDATYSEILVLLKEYVQDNYPPVVEMSEIYNSAENTSEVYAGIIDKMFSSAESQPVGDICKDIHLAYNGDSDLQAIRSIFSALFRNYSYTYESDSTDFIDIQRLITKTEDRYYYANNADYVDNFVYANNANYTNDEDYVAQYANHNNNYNYAYWELREAGTAVPFYYSPVASSDPNKENYVCLKDVSKEIIDFILDYVANNVYVKVDVTPGETIYAPIYYVYENGAYHIYRESNKFDADKEYYLRSTPFAAILINVEKFGYTRMDIEKGLAMLQDNEDDETYQRYMAVFKGQPDNSLYDLRYYFDSDSDLYKVGFNSADDLCVEFAAYLYYSRFLKMLEKGTSDERIQAGTLAAYASKNTEKTRAALLARLYEIAKQESSFQANISEYDSTETRNRKEAEALAIRTRGQAVLNTKDYFNTPENKNDCLSSRAFKLLMDKRVAQNKGVFDADYKAREDAYIDGIFYTEAKSILDQIKDSWPTSGGDVDFSAGFDNGYNSNKLFIYNRVYRLFIWKNGGVQAGYDLATDEGTGEKYPLSFVSDNTYATDILSCEDYFRFEAETNGREYNEAVAAFYKDYAVRALLYFYNNVANESQRKIVAEVAGPYVGESFTEESCIEAIGSNKGLDSKSLFLTLLKRYDMGKGYKEMLYNSYYALYLTEALNMIRYAAKHGKVIEPSSQYMTNSPYESARKSALNMGLAIFGKDAEGNLTDEEKAYLFGDDQTEGVLHNYYREFLKGYILRGITTIGASLGEVLIEEKKEELKADFVPEAYAVYYQGGYKDELDEILEYIVHAEDNTDPRYQRVQAIIRKDKGITDLSIPVYPDSSQYNRKIFYRMVENTVEEELSQFYEATEKGIVKSLYQEVYDELYLLTLSAEDFARLMYYYLKDADSSDMRLTEVLNDYVCNTSKLELNYYESRLLEGWWDGAGFRNAVRTYLNKDNFVISSLESALLRSVFDQQFNLKGDVKKALCAMPGALYELLDRFDSYCKAIEHFEGNEPIDRGILTTENTLYKNYDNVTIDYKYYFIDAFMNNDDFMYSYEYVNGELSNSFSLLQMTLQNYYEQLLIDKVKEFLKASKLSENDYTDRTDYVNILIECLAKEGFKATTSDYNGENDSEKQANYNAANASFMEYVRNIVTVLSHTSVYVNMELGESNPLPLYVRSVYRRITGISGTKVNESDMENGTVTENVSEMKMLSLRYYVVSNKTYGNIDYQKVIESLYKKRTVKSSFYSADHLNKESSDEELRHVIYLDSGRTGGWGEYVAGEDIATAANSINDASIYYANSHKTTERIVVKDDADDYSKYIDNYINEFTEYTINVNKSLAKTSIVFSNSYVTNDITFMLDDSSLIRLYFDPEAADSEAGIYNTIEIDVLNPVLPDKVRAKGFVGGQETDLGYITNFEYSEKMKELLFNIDPDTRDTEKGYSRVITRDDAYSVVIYGDSGRKYYIQLTVNFLDRSIDKIYMLNNDYTHSSQISSGDYAGYFPLYSDSIEAEDGSIGTNVININPADSKYIKAGSYIMPEEIYILYGNGTFQKYTDVVWDTSMIQYSLSGTGDNGYLTTRILSYRLDKEEGYSTVTFNYDGSIVTLRQFSDSSELIGDPIEYQINGSINWNVRIHIADKTIESVQAQTGSVVYGNIYTDTSVPTLIGAIDCTSYKINQFYPEFPEHVKLILHGDSDNEVNVDLSQSDWTIENETELRSIVQGNPPKDKAFTAYFTYLGYRVRMRFGIYDNINLSALTQPGEYMNGGTIYLIQGQESAEKQIKKYYSTIYFNFGSTEEPDWKKVPLYIDIATDNVTADYIGVFNGKDDKGVKGTVGVSEPGIIDNNIAFTIRVVSPKLFATMQSSLNDYVIYDYYCYAHNSENNLATSLVDSPPSMGSYFVTSSDSDVRFEIEAMTEGNYDFDNNVVEVPVTYPMTMGSDARLALDKNGTAKYSMVIIVPLKTYLDQDVNQGSGDNVIFYRNEESTNSKWTWVESTDAIVWKLGETMKASDLPQGKTLDNNKVIDFAWDLSDVNVNLASEEGYVVRGYYFTSANRWVYKELRVYIDKINVAEALIQSINGNKGRSIGKTYDAKYFKLEFNSDDYRYRRSDGSFDAISTDNFYVEYKLASDEDGNWSRDAYPINAGDYHIRIIMNDYNYYLQTTDESGNVYDYLLFDLEIEPWTIDISDIAFISQSMNTSNATLTLGISTIYNGEAKDVVVANWFKSMTEREDMFNGYKSLGRNDIEAAAAVYQAVYNRLTKDEEMIKEYLNELYIISEAHLAKTMAPDWNTYTPEQKANYCGAYMYNNVLGEPVLPYVVVDNWFADNEKATIVTMYMTGNGSGNHSGISYEERAAKALAYSDIYARVNDAAKAVMRGLFDQAKKELPSDASEEEIYALTYDYLPEELVICEIALHIEYRGFDQYLDGAPRDVLDGNYTVEISILAEENNGNYVSASNVQRTLAIKKDETIEYEISGSMIYNGTAQNPNVSYVTDSDGNLAPGVSIRYEYTLPDIGTLVVVRSYENGTQIDTEATTREVLEAYSYAGLRNVGEYAVKITVDGGNNYISMTDSAYTGVNPLTGVVTISPADIFLSIEDINAYYLNEVADFTSYIRINNSATKSLCSKCMIELENYNVSHPEKGIYYLVCPNCQVKVAVDLSAMDAVCGCPDCTTSILSGGDSYATVTLVTRSGNTETYRIACPRSGIEYLYYKRTDLVCGSCDGELVPYPESNPQDGYYYLMCHNCKVKIAVDFTRLKAVCNCADCTREINNGGRSAGMVELYARTGDMTTYRIYCPNSGTEYFVYMNTDRLMGEEKLSDVGAIVYSSSIRSFSPVGKYSIGLWGLGLVFVEQDEEIIKQFTKFGDIYRGDYRQLLLQENSVDNPNSLYKLLQDEKVKAAQGKANNVEYFERIIQMFRNYNFYLKEEAVYTITTEDDAVGVSSDAELQEILDSLQNGDEKEIYLSPMYDAMGEVVPYQPITIDKDINLTLVGYYKAGVEEKIFESAISGITVNKGSLSLRIIEVRVPANGGRGVIIEKDAASVHIEECLFTVAAGEGNKDACGIYTAVGYTDKVSVLGGTKFEKLRIAIWFLGGELEVNECSFKNNNTGIQIVSVAGSVNVQKTTFENHNNYAVYSVNSHSVVLNNTFRYNRVAIKLPEVLNDDTYKNSFVDADGNNTNAVNIETDGEEE